MRMLNSNATSNMQQFMRIEAAAKQRRTEKKKKRIKMIKQNCNNNEWADKKAKNHNYQKTDRCEAVACVRFNATTMASKLAGSFGPECGPGRGPGPARVAKTIERVIRWPLDAVNKDLPRSFNAFV